MNLVKPLNYKLATVCDPALPFFAYTADNFAVMWALYLVTLGDIIACATDIYNSAAIVGDLVFGMMKNKGAATFVTSSMVRDQVVIEPWRFL